MFANDSWNIFSVTATLIAGEQLLHQPRITGEAAIKNWWTDAEIGVKKSNWQNVKNLNKKWNGTATTTIITHSEKNTKGTFVNREPYLGRIQRHRRPVFLLSGPIGSGFWRPLPHPSTAPFFPVQYIDSNENKLPIQINTMSRSHPSRQKYLPSMIPWGRKPQGHWCSRRHGGSAGVWRGVCVRGHMHTLICAWAHIWVANHVWPCVSIQDIYLVNKCYHCYCSPCTAS